MTVDSDTRIVINRRYVPADCPPERREIVRDICRTSVWAEASKWLMDGVPMLMQMQWEEGPDLQSESLFLREEIRIEARLYMRPAPDQPLIRRRRRPE